MCLNTFAWDLDTSVEDELRKNYNPYQIEEDYGLPPLPKILEDEKKGSQPQVQTQSQIQQQKQTSTPKPQENFTVEKIIESPKIKPSNTSILGGNYATIKKGKKFKVKLATNLSDKCPKGARLTLITKYPVTTTYGTVPSNTKFKGVIVESHRPQLTGNGGLIVIKVDNIILNDYQQPVNAYITKAANKKIFFNNIKGKRKYISNTFKSTKFGQKYFSKMWKTTKSLAKDGATVIFTPFPLITGTVVYGVNVITSPLFGIFSKGGSLTIPAGSDFEIKLLEDLVIYN